MLTRFKTLSLVLVMISSMSVPICNRFHARLANSSEITTLMPTCTGLLEGEPTGSRLELLKFAFNAKNFIGRLSWSISSHFIAIHCALEPKISKNSLKSPFGGVQGRSRSLMLINLKSPPLVLVITSSMYAPICNRFHATQANSSKITTFRRYPFLMSTCAGLLELRGSELGLLSSTFNAENYIRRLSGSISSHFGAFCS